MQPKRYRIVLWSLFVAQLLWAAGFIYTAWTWGRVGILGLNKPTISCPHGIGVSFSSDNEPYEDQWNRMIRCMKEWHDEHLPDWIYTALPLVWGGVFASPALTVVWLLLGVRTMRPSWKKWLGLVGLSIGSLILTMGVGLIESASLFPDSRFFYPLNDENRPVRWPTETAMPEKQEPFDCWTASRPAAGDLSQEGEGELLLVVSDEAQDQQELYQYLVPHRYELYQYDFSSKTYTLLFDKIEKPTIRGGERFSPDGRQLWYEGSTLEHTSSAIFLFDRREEFPRKLFNNLNYIHYRSVWDWPMNWSNDGECLFLSETPKDVKNISERSVLAYRVRDGAMQQQPAAFAAERFVAIGEVAISHDGGYRALLCDPKDYTVKVCVLSTADAQEIKGAGLDQEFGRAACGPRWSPVENVLAFAHGETGTQQCDRVRLVSVSGAQAGTYRDIPVPGGGEEELLWSPDGKRLLLGGRWIYTLETEQMEEIADATTTVGEVAWSPDGSKVVFSTLGDGSLNVFDLTTHRSQKLPPMPGQAGLVLEMFWAR